VSEVELNMLSQIGPIVVSVRKFILDQKCQTQLLSHFDSLKIIRFLSSAPFNFH
jgi:hypothetical protein